MTFFFLWKIFWKYVVSSCCFKTVWPSFLCGTQKKKFCKTSWWLFHNGLWLEDVTSKDAKRNNIWVFSSCRLIAIWLTNNVDHFYDALLLFGFLTFSVTIHCHRLVHPFKCLLLHFAKLLMPYKFKILTHLTLLWGTIPLIMQAETVLKLKLVCCQQDSILCITGAQACCLGRQPVRFRHNRKRLCHAPCCWCLLTCLRDELEQLLHFYLTLQTHNITGCYMTKTSGKGYADKSLLDQSHPGKTTK